MMNVFIMASGVWRQLFRGERVSDLNPHKVPSHGLSGLKQYWRNDLIAGFSVALVALPLALGIALASGAPPMSGLLSAIIGGLFATFFRGSHIAINGPGNGLIVIILAAMSSIGGGVIGGFQYVLAACVVSGGIMMLLGLLRLGKIGDALPSSVIHGMLAAIGVIILSKQAHLMLGVSVDPGSAIDLLKAIPSSLLKLKAEVAIVGLGSLAVLFTHPKLNSKFVHFIPAPLWVLILSIPAGYLLGIDSHIRVTLPDDIAGSLVHPDFSKIGSVDFWLVVASITLIATIENLASVKAVENLDAYRRPSDLNKDLMGMGASTILAGFLGALPVITVIARSSVNVNHGAHTRWSNFAHGGAILIFVLVLPVVIKLIPLAALAGILVYTGYKLSSPQVMQAIALKGITQVLIFAITFYSVLSSGILWGLSTGVFFTIAYHFSRAGMPFGDALRALVRPSIDIIRQKDRNFYIRVRGIANFITLLPLQSRLASNLPAGEHAIIDFHSARLVDYTLLEYLGNYRRRYQEAGGVFDIVGLDVHQVSSEHPYALHTLVRPSQKKRLTQRQKDLQMLAERHRWQFAPPINWDVDFLRNFLFFETRPIEYRNNLISGSLVNNVEWEISDITFDEGALIVAEVYHTTVAVIHLPVEIPVFTLEKEAFFDRLMEFAGYEDVDFKLYPEFSKKVLLKSSNKEAIEGFFTTSRLEFFENEEIYHVESLGKSLLIFRHFRLASPVEIERMTQFCEKLVRVLCDLSTADCAVISSDALTFDEDDATLVE